MQILEIKMFEKIWYAYEWYDDTQKGWLNGATKSVSRRCSRGRTSQWRSTFSMRGPAADPVWNVDYMHTLYGACENL
jgi:hypothetical protein